MEWGEYLSKNNFQLASHKKLKIIDVSLV